MALSIIASYVSALTILGYPAEMYAFGGQWWLHAAGTAIGAILAVLVFIPVLYPLRLVSLNEYLELRFESKTVKLIGTLASVTNMVSMQ